MAEETSKVPVATLEYEPTTFEQALIKHKSKLILVGVIAVAGTVGYWGWRLVKEAKHEKASIAFTRAKTVDELKKVASEFAGQAAAGSAQVMAAEKLFNEGKKTDAIALLKEYLSQNPEHPLRDLASWRIAEYTAANGDAAAAATEYEAVGQTNSPYSGFALLRLGDIKLGAGEKEKAQEYYDKILRNAAMTGNPARIEAQSRIDRAMKLKPPALVEYVAPLLPPPKLDAPGNGPTPGGANGLPPGMSLPPGMELPPGLSLDSEPFTPPAINNKPFDTPGLLDTPPPPAPTSPPATPPEAGKDSKGAAGDPAKPATGTQP